MSDRPQATKVLVERGGETGQLHMTQRAMRRAAKLHPDLVRYEKKNGVSRLVRVDEGRLSSIVQGVG